MRVLRRMSICITGLLVLQTCLVWAEQRPIYSSVDPARADEYEAALEVVMAMSEEEMLGYLPELPFIYWCECPNCYGGNLGRFIFTWTIDRPNELTCRYCEDVISLPDERYPETGRVVGENALGEEVAFSYYLNEERDHRHFLTAHLWYYHRIWLTRQCIALGRAWLATGNSAYARRVVLVLDRAATLYPHYPAIHNRAYIRRGQFCESQEPPYPFDAGRWGHFHNEIPRTLLRAYDLIYDSDQFEALSEERGYDVRTRVENDFFRATYHAVELKPSHVGNTIGYDRTDAAMMGRILGDPAMVHQAFRWIQSNLNEGFFYDGTWKESASYHYMTLGGLRRAFSVVEGYSDPPGYVDEVSGIRFDDLDPIVVAPFWGKVQDAFKLIDHPDGTSPAVNDTHPHEQRSEARDATVSAILPGFGQASLGRGSGTDQMQAQLHFGGSHGHAHRDTLGMLLWAKEREMLSDIGYTRTQMRWWTGTTISHNLVAIDRQEQRGRPADGDLLRFFPGADDSDISVVEADGLRSYANIEDLDMYLRLLMVVPISAADAYVVDIFRTRGGSMHDWLLQGSADEDMRADLTLPLTEAGIGFAGENPPRTYDLWRTVQRGDAQAGFAVTFAYADEPDRGTRTHVAGDVPTAVYIGEVPSVRRAGIGDLGDDRRIDDYWMPKLAARRAGESPLHSVFAAVHEPFLGGTFIDSVVSLDLTPADENCVALQVTSGATTDTIISTLDDEPFPRRSAGDVTMRGRLGVVRQVDGEVTAVWLFEGREISAAGVEITADAARLAGTIVAATRVADGAEHDALLTTATLPHGDELRGSWLIVRHGNGFRHGYEIDRIGEVDGRTAIILSHDHGLRIDGEITEEVYYPGRSIEGVNSFVIPLGITPDTGGR